MEPWEQCFSKVFIYTGYIQKNLCKIIPWKFPNILRNTCVTASNWQQKHLLQNNSAVSFVLLWNLFGSIVPRSSCTAGNYCTKCNTREPRLFWYPQEPQVSSVSTACTVLCGNMYFQQEAWKLIKIWHDGGHAHHKSCEKAPCSIIHTILLIHAFLPLKTLINSLCIYFSIFSIMVARHHRTKHDLGQHHCQRLSLGVYVLQAG